jgi:hypothetical protein
MLAFVLMLLPELSLAVLLPSLLSDKTAGAAAVFAGPGVLH